MEILKTPPQGSPCLVLNADFRPLSYYPLFTWSWQEAIKNVFLDRVNIVATYEQPIRSPSFSMRAPSVVSLKEFVKQDRPPAFTRFNVFLRDGFACVYCDADVREDLTFDHLIPRSQGGRTTWTNIVTACASCNLKKGGRTAREADMPLRRPPRRPNMAELQSMGRKFPPKYLHESWMDFLYWDVELEA